MNWSRALLVATSMACLDVVWTFYIQATVEKRAARSAALASLLALLAAFNTVSIVEDWRMAIASGVGAWLGTYWAVRRSCR